MAGNGDGNRIRGARLRHCSHCLRCSDALGDVGVACGPTRGDAADGLPDPPLERGTADVERKIKPARRCLNKADDLGHPLLKPVIGTDELRLGKSILQLANQLLRFVPKLDGAHPFVRGCNQDGAQRALTDRKTNGHVFASRTHLARCHP